MCILNIQLLRCYKKSTLHWDSYRKNRKVLVSQVYFNIYAHYLYISNESTPKNMGIHSSLSVGSSKAISCSIVGLNNWSCTLGSHENCVCCNLSMTLTGSLCVSMNILLILYFLSESESIPLSLGLKSLQNLRQLHEHENRLSSPLV